MFRTCRVNKFLKCGEIKSKAQMLDLIRIRQITVVGDDKEKVLVNSRCTCPDYFKSRVCQHLLACLIFKELYNPDIEFKKQNKRGRKAQ